MKYIICQRIAFIDYGTNIGLWCLTQLSTIFQLYRDGEFYWWRKPEENHRPAASHSQTLLYYGVSSTHLRHERD